MERFLSIAICLILASCGANEDITEPKTGGPEPAPRNTPSKFDYQFRANLQGGAKGSHQVRLTWKSDGSARSFGIIRHSYRPEVHVLLTVNLTVAEFIDGQTEGGMKYKYELVELTPTSGYNTMGEVEITIPKQ